MWFSVVYSFIDNDTRHHSGQNLLWTHSAALLSISEQTHCNIESICYLVKIYYPSIENAVL